jgi:hypothetical protein
MSIIFQKAAFGDNSYSIISNNLQKAGSFALKLNLWKTTDFHVSNYSNKHAHLEALDCSSASIDEQDCRAFSGQPLAEVTSMNDFIDQKPIDPSNKIPSELPFNLS